jgi:predicted porin
LEKLAMKKTLIALAALAATGAFAQSSVQIDGIMDVGFQSINYKGGKASGINGNGASTSQINFRGTEDLGGGLKANFRVETDWNTVSNKANTGSVSSPVTLGNETVAAASTFGNGEIRAGLEGGFGRVDLGAVNYNSLSSYVTGQPFGTAIGSGFRTFYVNDAQPTSQVRSDNALKYVSPSFSGLTASVYYAAKQTKAVDTTASATSNAVKQTSFSTAFGAYDMQGTTELGINYVNGPLAASFSTLKQDFNAVGTGTTESTVNTLGANYTLGAAKVFGLYQTNKTNTNSVDNSAMSISGTYTMGAIVVMAQMGTLTNDVTTAKSKIWGLGADYNLSKRSSVYFRAESIDDKAGSVQAAVTPGTIKGTDTKFARTAVGIRHNF